MCDQNTTRAAAYADNPLAHGHTVGVFTLRVRRNLAYGVGNFSVSPGTDSVEVTVTLPEDDPAAPHKSRGAD